MLQKISAATSDPVIIALRSQMKGEFLAAFARDNSLHGRWDNAELIVYGSTLMRQLARNEDVFFPLEGIKSSDIDIGVMEKGKPSSDENFTANMVTTVAPLIRKAVADAGFSYLWETNEYGTLRTKKATAPEEVRQLPNGDFIGDFFVTKTFSPQEMHERLKDRSDYQELRPFIPAKPLEVRLVLGVNEKPFPILLDPMDTKPETNIGAFKRTRTLDMLAGKIVRCMTDKYKPTDIIDIYNLIKGYHRSGGKPLKNLDSTSPNNHIDNLRTLIIAYMPQSRGIRPDRKDLLDTLKETPENKQRFLDRVASEIASNKMPLVKEKLDDIFATINQLLEQVIGTRKGTGPLKFSANEKAFFTEIDGYIESEESDTPVPSKRLGLFAQRHVVPPPTRTEIEPRINVERLRQEHPQVFKKYPEFAQNLENNPILQSKITESKFGPASGAGEILLDF